MKEDEILNVYDKDDDWLLTSSQTAEGRVGYVPANYVEEVRFPLSVCIFRPVDIPADQRGGGSIDCCPCSSITSVDCCA